MKEMRARTRTHNQRHFINFTRTHDSVSLTIYSMVNELYIPNNPTMRKQIQRKLFIFGLLYVQLVFVSTVVFLKIVSTLVYLRSDLNVSIITESDRTQAIVPSGNILTLLYAKSVYC